MKQLIVLCDGTGNSPETVTGAWSPTNVQILKDILTRGTPREQKKGYSNFSEGWSVEEFQTNSKKTLVHYDRGLGSPRLGNDGQLLKWSWQPSSFFSNAQLVHSKFITTGESVAAIGIIDNVAQAYRFLAQNYEAGDEVFLFGFSRGAYTLRLLISIIRYIGLMKTEGLTEDEINKAIEKGFSLYNMQVHPEDNAAAKAFRDQGHPNNNLVKFLGLWDTVPGMVQEKVYDISKLTSVVKTARHAISIDEERKVFEPALWKDKTSVDSKQGWFSGVHCDIGGGYMERGLSNIALQWMIKEAHNLGLNVDLAHLKAAEFNPDALAMQHDSLNARMKENFAFTWAHQGIHKRQVLQSDSSEKLHESVLKRYGKTVPQEGKHISYKPSNLHMITPEMITPKISQRIEPEETSNTEKASSSPPRIKLRG